MPFTKPFHGSAFKKFTRRNVDNTAKTLIKYFQETNLQDLLNLSKPSFN